MNYNNLRSSSWPLSRRILCDSFDGLICLFSLLSSVRVCVCVCVCVSVCLFLRIHLQSGVILRILSGLLIALLGLSLSPSLWNIVKWISLSVRWDFCSESFRILLPSVSKKSTGAFSGGFSSKILRWRSKTLVIWQHQPRRIPSKSSW